MPGTSGEAAIRVLLPPDEGGQAGRVQGVKAAPHGTRPQRRPGPRRPGDALEVPGPEILQLEEIAEQPARAVGDDDGTRLGQSLQARREVRRLADDRLLLRGTRADQVADHDKPGGDADAAPATERRQRSRARRRLDQGKPGLHSVLGVMLVGLGIAEIGQHPVAHVLGDEPAGLGDEIGAASVIGADDLAQILGIEPRRECRRADQIAEHHRQLPAFGLARQRGDGSRCTAQRRLGQVTRRLRPQGRDRGQQLAAMADRGYADADQVVGRQLRQHFAIDIVVAECRRVLLKPQPAQPRRYVHAVILGSEERQPLIDDDIPLPFGLPAAALK